MGNQRATSSWRSDKQDVWSGEPRVPGLTPGFDGNGNSFWLPWYRYVQMAMFYEHYFFCGECSLDFFFCLSLVYVAEMQSLSFPR